MALFAATFCAMASTGCTHITPASAPATRENGPISLFVAPAKSSFAAGETVVLHVTVTNQSSGPCELPTEPDGGLVVVAATLNGATIAPVASTVEYLSGFAAAIAGDVAAVAPGDKASFDWTSMANAGPVDGQSLTIDTGTADADAATSLWPVSKPGTYMFTLQYQEPKPIAGNSSGCASSSDTSAARFEVMG